MKLADCWWQLTAGVGLLAYMGVACEQRAAPPPESARSEAKPPDALTAERAAAPTSNSAAGPLPAVTQTLTPEARMAFHSREAEALRGAVIAGDYASGLPQAKALSENNWTPHLKPVWQQHMREMYGAAKLYAEASNLLEAAGAVGKLGLACASCHRVLGGPKPSQRAAEPPEAPMAAHAWATEQLWLGLTAPHDAAWLLGAGELSKSPAVRSDVAVVDNAAKRLQALGNKAFITVGDAKADVLSEVLVTCAQCHRRTGAEPR